MNELIENIKVSEGFESKPYKCSMDKLTIGYGTNIEDGISKEEAELLLKYRLERMINNILEKKPIIVRLPKEKQEALFEMSYQLGVNGVLGFRKMWKALEDFNYEVAADEMLDSIWFSQTPNRAKRLSEIIRA